MKDTTEPLDGATDLDDYSGLKLPSDTTYKLDEIYVYEAKNIAKATIKYLSAPPSVKIAPFTYAWMLELHREMFGDVWEWAGSTRTQDTQIGLDKYQIGEALRTLAADIQEWPEHFEPVEVAARIHHRAVQIHPFKNGNGRWSRLLANIWLKQNDHPLTVWPSIVGESLVRDEYLKAVREADNMNFKPFLEMHKRYTDEG